MISKFGCKISVGYMSRMEMLWTAIRMKVVMEMMLEQTGNCSETALSPWTEQMTSCSRKQQRKV